MRLVWGGGGVNCPINQPLQIGTRAPSANKSSPAARCGLGPQYRSTVKKDIFWHSTRNVCNVFRHLNQPILGKPSGAFALACSHILRDTYWRDSDVADCPLGK
jgi:hypothetical protein